MWEIQHKLLGLFIICFIFSPLTVEASMYPLQVKYPEIMLYKAETNQKVIALTFDDGPDERFTPGILDILKKHNIKATFFLLGTRVEKYHDVAKRIAHEKHVIGSHTYWHPDLTKGSVDSLVWEVNKTEATFQSVIDLKPYLFRAPYGALNEDLVETLGEMGYKGIGWSVDSEDWKSLSKEEIKKNTLNGIHPGAIVLMHSAGHWTQDLSGTAEALNELIPHLKDEGYTFVTVPELWKLELK